MANSQFYCKMWSEGYREAIDIWDEKKAQNKHDKGQNYTVAFGPKGHPNASILVGKDFALVSFYDEMIREYLGYSFKKVNDGSLFLSMANWREFIPETFTVAYGETFIFKEDGNVHIIRERFHPAHKIETADFVIENLSDNYDKFPEFGYYDHLLRKERNIVPT